MLDVYCKIDVSIVVSYYYISMIIINVNLRLLFLSKNMNACSWKNVGAAIFYNGASDGGSCLFNNVLIRFTCINGGVKYFFFSVRLK